MSTPPTMHVGRLQELEALLAGQPTIVRLEVHAWLVGHLTQRVTEDAWTETLAQLATNFRSLATGRGL